MVNVEALVEREVLRIGEAAHALGIDPQALRRWVAKGLVPAWRMPGTGERRFAATIIVALRRQLEGTAVVHPVVEHVPENDVTRAEKVLVTEGERRDRVLDR